MEVNGDYEHAVDIIGEVVEEPEERSLANMRSEMVAVMTSVFQIQPMISIAGANRVLDSAIARGSKRTTNWKKSSTHKGGGDKLEEVVDVLVRVVTVVVDEEAGGRKSVDGEACKL